VSARKSGKIREGKRAGIEPACNRYQVVEKGVIVGAAWKVEIELMVWGSSSLVLVLVLVRVKGS